MFTPLLLMLACGGAPSGEPPTANPVALTGAQLDYVGTWERSTGLRAGSDTTLTVRADGTADYRDVPHSDGESGQATGFSGQIHITPTSVRIIEVARGGQVVELAVTTPPTVATASGDANDAFLGMKVPRMGDTVLVADGRWIRQDPPHRESVDAQRARLAAAAGCDDPLAGVWTGGSHVLAPALQFWQLEELRLKRGDDDAIVATLVSHYWGGRRDDPAPPADCADKGYLHGKAKSDASWTLTDGKAQVHPTGTPSVLEAVCDTATTAKHPWLPYSGTLDAETQELTLTQDDVRGPLVLRRTSCGRDD